MSDYKADLAEYRQLMWKINHTQEEIQRLYELRGNLCLGYDKQALDDMYGTHDGQTKQVQ